MCQAVVFAQLSFWWNWIAPLPLLLFVGACVGHTALQVWGFNYFLGLPNPRWLSRVVRRLNMGAIFVAPLFFWLTFAFGLDAIAASFVGRVWLAFTILCCVIGLTVAPVLNLIYWRQRRRPALLSSNHSDIHDIAAELGYHPIGRGKYRYLARLPRNEIYQVEFNQKHIHLAKLPDEWEGLTILHLTDLHFRGMPDKVFFQKVMDHCEKWTPDLIAVTGDIVDSGKHHRWVLPILGRLRAQIGAYAILGNHDKWYDPPVIRRRLRRAGLRVLENTWEQIEVRGRPMIVIGHEGPWFPPEPDLSECPTDVFRLCLSHTPDNIVWAQRNRINLMLSGHNHGGQIRLPWIGSVYVPSRYSRRYDCGTFNQSPTVLHVGRGLAGQHPVRYNCRPEVTLLVLHRA